MRECLIYTQNAVDPNALREWNPRAQTIICKFWNPPFPLLLRCVAWVFRFWESVLCQFTTSSTSPALTWDLWIYARRSRNRKLRAGNEAEEFVKISISRGVFALRGGKWVLLKYSKNYSSICFVYLDDQSDENGSKVPHFFNLKWIVESLSSYYDFHDNNIDFIPLITNSNFLCWFHSWKVETFKGSKIWSIWYKKVKLGIFSLFNVLN